MARQPDIQYVRFRYNTDGSAARKPEPEIVRKKAVPQPKPRASAPQRSATRVDPVSLVAMVVAAVMLVAMAVGLINLAVTKAKAEGMEQYVTQLRAENTQLRQEYVSGYDLADIEKQALAMGMIPIEDAEHVYIQVEVPQADPEPTFWEEVGLFFTELFG